MAKKLIKKGVVPVGGKRVIKLIGKKTKPAT